MPGDLWTAEDVERVKIKLREHFHGPDETAVGHNWISPNCVRCNETTEAALAALAEAGRLLPADAAEREQWGFRRKEGGMVYQTGKDAAQVSVQPMRRRVWVGPWQPVPDEVKP